MSELTSGDIHAAQMAILNDLSCHKNRSFSDLQKACDLTSDHANFHIKKLIGIGYVAHVPKSYGEYHLTPAGKRYANRFNPNNLKVEEQPKLSVVLWVTNNDGRLLRQERMRQPYHGFWTRPTGKIRRGETVLQAAARKLKDETGLTADLKVAGVEHRIDKNENGELNEDKYLFIVEGTNPTGNLIVQTESAKNHWVSEQEYSNVIKRFGKPTKATVGINALPILFTEGEYEFNAEDY